jgi:ParB/RepB/Spo0J family partition protein
MNKTTDQSSFSQSVVDGARRVFGESLPAPLSLLDDVETPLKEPSGELPSPFMNPQVRVGDRIRDRLARRDLGHRARQPVVEMETRDIPLVQIATASIQNCRKNDDQENFKHLVDSMASQGLLEPVIVVRDTHRENHFILLAGFRRFRAAGELGWPRIRAQIHPPVTKVDAYLINLFENSARQDISTYELARRCKDLVGLGLSESELAERLNYSRTYVHNLIRYLDLPIPILESWEHRHPLMNLHCLQRLAAAPLPVEMWETMRTRHARAEGKPILSAQELLLKQLEEMDGGEDGHKPIRRRSQARIRKLCDVLLRMKMPTDPEKVRALAVGIANYCRGVTNSIPGVVW